MKAIETIKMLEKCPIFTFNEFVRMTGSSQAYARTCLYRLKKKGLILQVERGKYTAFDDPMIFSSRIVVPSYISFWTAIRFYNLTEQLPRDIMLASPKSRKALEFKGTKIRFFRTSNIWGYGKQRYRDFDIFVAEKEKCIIDSLVLRNVPFDEIAKAIETGELDRNVLAEYAKKAGNKAVIKRLGYLMEAFGMDAGGLEERIDSNYVLLDWNGPKTGKKDRKWKIIVNRRLHDIH